MKKSFSGMLVAALAVAGVLGTSSRANAALLIDFDNVLFDGGTITSLGGGDYMGSGIIFDTIHYRDTTGGPGGTSLTLGGLQCGGATSSDTATVAGTCKLSFDTSTNMFSVVAPEGLYAIGADDQSYTSDTGLQIVANGATVLSGTILNHTSLTGIENTGFGAVGTDTKNAAMLAFFGLPADTQFSFVNTEVFANSNGVVSEADLINFVSTPIPEPTTMMLLGTGLLAAFRARRKSA